MWDLRTHAKTATIPIHEVVEGPVMQFFGKSEDYVTSFHTVGRLVHAIKAC